MSGVCGCPAFRIRPNFADFLEQLVVLIVLQFGSPPVRWCPSGMAWVFAGLHYRTIKTALLEEVYLVGLSGIVFDGSPLVCLNSNRHGRLQVNDEMVQPLHAWV